MNIREVKVSDIKAYSKNAKKHNEEQITAIAKSIEKFGFRQPLVIDKNNEIVVGHGRYLAAVQLGMETVPCEYADNLTDEQVKALRIADNKLSEKGTWDNDILAGELKDIVGQIDMTDFGFGEFELSFLVDDMAPVEYDDEAISKYEIDDNQLLRRGRIIITYDKSKEQTLCDLLGIETINKVTYDISELVKKNDK